MNNHNILLIIFVAILTGCERDPSSCSLETGNVVLNIISAENDIDAFSQYTMKIIPEYSGEILVGKIGNFNWPLPLYSGYYRIEVFSSVMFVEDNIKYRYYGLSDLLKVEPHESITVPIEIKLSAFHVEDKIHQ